MAIAVINCMIPNGVELKLDEMIDDPCMPGTKIARQNWAPGIRLVCGRNEIDAEFWHAWRDLHKNGDIIKHLREDTENGESRT